MAQSTKSTLNIADPAAVEQNNEESKVEELSASNVAGDDANEETKKEKPSKKPKAAAAKKGRNRTKVVPSVAAGDYIADSDDEEFKEAIAKIEKSEAAGA